MIVNSKLNILDHLLLVYMMSLTTYLTEGYLRCPGRLYWKVSDNKILTMKLIKDGHIEV